MINMSIKNPSSVLHIYPTCLVDATYVSTWYPTSCRLPNLIQVPCLIWLRYKWVFHQGGLYLLMSSFGPVWKMTLPSISLLAFHSILVYNLVFDCFWLFLATKLPKYSNSLFTFLLSKARQVRRKFKIKKIMQPKWRKNQKRSYQNL